MSTEIIERIGFRRMNTVFTMQSVSMDHAAGVMTANIRVQNEEMNITKHCYFHLGEVSVDQNERCRGIDADYQDNTFANLVNIYKADLIELGT